VPNQVQPITLGCTINGERRELKALPMARLLDVLRDDLRLTGTKEGCGEGECGACSVMMDGRLVNSCLVPFVQVDGAELMTIEGLAKDDEMHPIQAAFVTCGGAQCGICTPGMIMASYALLKDSPQPAPAMIKTALAGNLCRCTGYVKIIDSVKAAAARMGDKP
jgi:carbon-monoxide dehydrogenase small subunit